MKDVTFVNNPGISSAWSYNSVMNKQIMRKIKIESAPMNPSLSCWLDRPRAREYLFKGMVISAPCALVSFG